MGRDHSFFSFPSLYRNAISPELKQTSRNQTKTENGMSNCRSWNDLGMSLNCLNLARLSTAKLMYLLAQHESYRIDFLPKGHLEHFDWNRKKKKKKKLTGFVDDQVTVMVCLCCYVSLDPSNWSHFRFIIIFSLVLQVMVTNVTSLLKTVKAVEDEHTRGTRALESTIEAIAQEIRVCFTISLGLLKIWRCEDFSIWFLGQNLAFLGFNYYIFQLIGQK